MATVNGTSTAVLAPRGEAARVTARSAPPQLLRCMVVSLSADRRRLIRTAAEAQAWDAIVCRDAGEFLRTAFKRSVPLIVVDLPDASSLAYVELKGVVERTKEITSSLMLVVGTGTDELEEGWARQLGAWAYLCEANSLRGFEFLLGEAREAVERRELLAPVPIEFADSLPTAE
jgi:hypothetical protein